MHAPDIPSLPVFEEISNQITLLEEIGGKGHTQTRHSYYRLVPAVVELFKEELAHILVDYERFGYTIDVSSSLYRLLEKLRRAQDDLIALRASQLKSENKE